ncbi:MAG: inositol monophosphatase family protein [Sphingomicrobium sp.]
MTDATSFLALAEQLADAAREQTLSRWGQGIAADNKASAGWDPVTEADREAERAMRDLIAAAHPNHGVDGEEFPFRAPNGPWTWSLDPIDGTRAFVCQLPTWVTLIGLLHEGRPILGLIDAPCLNERYVGYSGEARMVRDGQAHPLKVSGCTSLTDARLSSTDPYMFGGAGFDAFQELRQLARTTRFGFDGYAYARLAAGSIDLVVESGLKTYDYNALIPVVRSAGGVFGDWNGGEDFSDGNVIAAASGELYEAAVAVMRAA